MEGDYTCADCRADIDKWFEPPYSPLRPEQIAANDRALEHMTAGSAVGHHHVACQPCWDYYMEQKQLHGAG